MTKNILYTNEMFPVRLVFLIDICITAVSFILSYYLCSLILPDILSHGMLVQLPIIVALTSLIFLFIGIYKGYVKYDKVREVYSIFNAICITNILTIVLVVVNGKLFMEKELMVPLSIIIVHSIISFSALAVSRYLYKYFTTTRRSNLQTQEAHLYSVFIYEGNLSDKDTIISLLQRKEGVNNLQIVNSKDYPLAENLPNGTETQNFYVTSSVLDNSPEFIKSLSKMKRPIYQVSLDIREGVLEKDRKLSIKPLSVAKFGKVRARTLNSAIFDKNKSTPFEENNEVIEHQTI